MVSSVAEDVWLVCGMCWETDDMASDEGPAWNSLGGAGRLDIPMLEKVELLKDKWSRFDEELDEPESTDGLAVSTLTS